MRTKLVLVLLSTLLSGTILAKKHEDKDVDLTIRSADKKNSITFGAELQTRAKFEATPVEGQDKTDFGIDMELKKAGLKISGTLLNPNITYQFKLSTKSQKEGGMAYLNKANVDWAFHRHTAITIGRFDHGFSREGHAVFALPDPSSAEEFFNIGKGKGDGFIFHNDEDARWAWVLGLVDTGFLGKINYNHGDIDGFNYTDRRGGGFRYAVGLGAYVSTNYWDKIAERTTFTLDFITKYRHLTIDAAAYYGLGQETGKELKHSWGGEVGAGYLINQRWEPAARYSLVHQATKKLVSHEIMAGLGRYFFEDHAKLQGYYKLALNDGTQTVGLDLFIKI